MKIEMKNQHLAQIIREEREKRNLTQEHLAQLAELSARTVQRIEIDGTHSKETLRAVAEAFEVDCKELLRMAQERAEKGGSRRVLAPSVNPTGIPPKNQGGSCLATLVFGRKTFPNATWLR